jgi:hypothetical protein
MQVTEFKTPKDPAWRRRIVTDQLHAGGAAVLAVQSRTMSSSETAVGSPMISPGAGGGLQGRRP